MKKRFVLFSLFFLIFGGMSVRSQVSQMYHQGFDSDESANYTVTPSNGSQLSTTIYRSGDRAIRLKQLADGDVEFIIGPLDFSQDLSLHYVALRFDHICRVRNNAASGSDIAKIFYKRENQSDEQWVQATSQHYDITEDNYSSSFSSFFNSTSYEEWSVTNNSHVSNSQWRSERFNFNNVITSSVSPNERKLMIKFVLKGCAGNTTGVDTASLGWWLDNISVTSSQDQMITPKITMVNFPDGVAYPNGRGARIMLSARSSLAAGINPDSVYMFYKVGSDPTEIRVDMDQMEGVANQFMGWIPFFGYDTSMYFRCVVHDATSNANAASFPAGEDTWWEYHYVRGVDQLGVETEPLVPTGSSNFFPLPNFADNKSEWVLDSAFMASAGYGPGSMTSLQFTLGASVTAQTRNRFQVRMANVGPNYTFTPRTTPSGTVYPFYNDYLCIVYDQELAIPTLNAGQRITLPFIDTFYYAGKDLLIQVRYDDNVDEPAVSIGTIANSATSKSTKWMYHGNASLNINLFANDQFTEANMLTGQRPVTLITQHANMPLLYDAGVSELVKPNFENPIMFHPDSIILKLKNYGARPINSIRISYSIDDTVTGYYDWTGNLAAGAEQEVIVNPAIDIMAGFHHIMAWVEDSLVSQGVTYRDHEPYNDTSYAEFIVCMGPMNGVRTVGNADCDFLNMDELLITLSRCGIDDSLIVRLAPGEYQPFTLPVVPGLSEQNYLVFEGMPTGRTVIYTDNTIGATALINLTAGHDVRLRNLDLIRRSVADGVPTLSEMVRLGGNSDRCYIENCRLIDSVDNPVASMRISQMINSGNADYLTVRNCDIRGGQYGVNVTGMAADIRSIGSSVVGSVFHNQYTSAIRVENQTNVVIDSNQLYDVMSNSNYVLMMTNCNGNVRVTRNKIYTSHGAGAIAVNNFVGTQNNRAVVANNMIVSAYMGNSSMFTALNIIQANWTDVAYNSVSFMAPLRSNVAAATFGGGVLDNCRFLNNIIASFDNVNYAFWFNPGNSTTNEVGNNIYYSGGSTLNRKGTSNYNNFTAWLAAMPTDTNSAVLNPQYLNGSLVDLRTFNRQVKGVGTPMANITTDMFGTLRDDNATCPGAFEFVSLDYDFEIEAMLSPEAEDCNMPDQVELQLQVHNNGVQPLLPGGNASMAVGYIINGVAGQQTTVSASIPAESSATVNTGIMLHLPSNGVEDSVYNITLWTYSANDPNQTNDTIEFTVVSRSHPSAPTDTTVYVEYAGDVTITPTAGIAMWPVYNDATAPMAPSQIYWYYDSTDAAPFFVGSSYTLVDVHENTQLHIRQQRSMPVLRFTELEIKRGSSDAGVMNPMPSWLISNRKCALQISNVGAGPANLAGDTLVVYIKTGNSASTLSNYDYVFGDVVLPAGQSLVLQFVASGEPAIANTLITGTAPSVSYSSNIAFIYKNNKGEIVDALPLNNSIGISGSPWESYNVPSYVWNGAAKQFVNNVSGMKRAAFNGNADDWVNSSSTNVMSLGSCEPDWIMYTDNGCVGDFGKVNVEITGLPAVELAVSDLVLPPDGCGLGMEPVSVTIHNYGTEASGAFTINYSSGNNTASETVSNGVPGNGMLQYTFNTPLNFAYSSDTIVDVTVWLNAYEGDNMNENDTVSGSVETLYTPAAPTGIADRVVEYATCDTVTLIPTHPGVIPIWYDYDGNPVDTGTTHITEILYGEGTMGVSLSVQTSEDVQINEGTTQSVDADPNPFNVKNKNSRQQYIYTADELLAAGCEPGPIERVLFYLDTIGNPTSSTLLDYTIGLGATADAVFSGNSDWHSTTACFSTDTLVITDAMDHDWVTFNLETPFVWDGTSNIVVEVSYHLTAGVSNGAKTLYGVKQNATLHKHQSGAITPTTNGSKGNNRPIMKLNHDFMGCSSSIAYYNVTLHNVPDVDAAAFWPEGADTVFYNSCDTIFLPITLRNQGSTPLTEADFTYWLDDNAEDSSSVTCNLLGGQIGNVPLFAKVLHPGRHTVTAVLSVEGDNVANNDTVSGSFVVRFCGGVYTIGQEEADYMSIAEACDTLNAVGIEGQVMFQVANGTYTEPAVLHEVIGSSPAKRVLFMGMGDSVTLSVSTGPTTPSTMTLDGASNLFFYKMCFDARPVANNVNKAKAIMMSGGDYVVFDSCTFKVKGTIVDTAASCVVMQGNMTNLTFRNSTFDSGYCSITSTGEGYAHIRIEDNTLSNFASRGINLRNAQSVTISRNRITSSNGYVGTSTSNIKPITGIYLALVTDTVKVQKNHIYLIDQSKGGKRGIQLENIVCTNPNQGYIVNNMIGTHSTDSKSGSSAYPSSGIWIDSSSTYLNIIFNSVRIYGTTSTASSAATVSQSFQSGTTNTNLQVMNNIFSNFSYGYAYCVDGPAGITASNFNAYYTQSAKAFKWGSNANIATLTALQNLSNADGNSVFDEPYFVAEDDLHLMMTNFTDKAQYNTEVTDDIDGNIRQQIPSPTIGAQEMLRDEHDVAVVRIIEPVMPANINNPVNIETDPIRVIASFYNNGNSTETNVRWYAYIEGFEEETTTEIRTFATLPPSTQIEDTVMITTMLGIIDTHVVHVVLLDALDTNLDDNELTAPVYLAPAFDFEVKEMIVTNSVTPAGCDMSNAQVSIKLKNVGFKPFPEGTQIKVVYHPEITQPAGLQIATMPDTVEEYYTLPSDIPITGAAATITVPFTTSANLYPTDTAIDIKVRMSGWYNYEYDLTRNNDTTKTSSSQPVKDSYYTPAPPLGHDTTLAYASWGAVTAEQENSRPIWWYTDSTDLNSRFHPTGNDVNNYNKSKIWSTTPQYYEPATYYLRCLSSKNCPSYFSTVTVNIAPHLPNDVGFASEPTSPVLAPKGNRVYMENDTVRVKVTNFGTSSQSNIPVTYQLKRNNQILQTVTETITATIAAGQDYVYTFDSLLAIPTPTTSANFSLSLWTDLANDGTRRNDTIRQAYSFKSLGQVVIDTSYNYKPTAEDTKFDITRLSWNGIDIDMPPLNRVVTNMGDYNNPEYPVVHVSRGTTDSLILEITPMVQDVQRFRVRATVEIDFDRNGKMQAFPDDRNEKVISGAAFYNDSVFRSVVSIPQCASYGYMRMRVTVRGYDPESTDGHVIDLLLFVDEEKDINDIGIVQIVSPRSYLIRDDQPKVVTFRVINCGRDPLTECNFYYSFVGDTVDPTAQGMVPWTGNLQPGHSMVVSLPEHHFPLGTSSLSIWHDWQSDHGKFNDTMYYEYHRFHTIRLPMFDEFEGIDRWYAPTGYNAYSHNYWERGMPDKTRFDTVYSGVNAWVTDLYNTIASGTRGNVSYLYSPIINIAQLKADTISFRLQRNLTNGSSLHLEFINYLGQWVKADPDSIHSWYNDEENRVFNGTTPGNAYSRYWFSTSGTGVNGDFPERLQFRFVYQTPMGTTSTAAYGGGCAVDDFRISRARRAIDIGITAITEPVSPRYGETIYPRVVVHNYGYDTVRHIEMGYVHYGTNLPKEAEFDCAIPPDGDSSFVFYSPFVVTSNFPDTFNITAFTYLTDDIIRDNDTTSKKFALAPLNNDISANSFIAPLDRVIAGDSTVTVTMRVRNFGVNPIEHATASYIVNGLNRVDEEIDFVETLGRPLESMEYFNYTFQQHFRASMGIMVLTGIVKCDSNEYIYNDTISKRIQGITTVVDIAAASVIVDTSSFNEVRIQLVIENNGARGANGFEVGFWVDNDTNTIFRERYLRDVPIPALSTGYHLFDTALATRAARYENVVAFVNIDGDNDPSNDTTNILARQFTDIEIMKIQLEENSNPECRVFAKVRNIGNVTHTGESAIQLKATINGTTVRYNAFHRIEPGQIVTIDFGRTVPKDPTRHYAGTGSFTLVGDSDTTNNQTSVIEVVNYMEGIPYVEADRMVLDQNYPNPFTGFTTIPFTLPEAAQVRLFIIDAMGHVVYNSKAVYPAGPNSVSVNLEAYPAGIYYYGIEACGERRMKKMIMK